MDIIYDNIIFSLQKAGGISAYWAELAERIDPDEVTFYEHDNDNIFREDLDISVQKESVLHPQILRFLPFTNRLPPNSLFHSSYHRVSLQSDVNNVVTIHDFTYEKFGEGLSRLVHVWQKRLAIHSADGIICVSENTKSDLLKLYPHVDEDSIRVIYNGVSEAFAALPEDSFSSDSEFSNLRDQRYILYVGSRAKYKNFDIAVRAVSKIEDAKLVMVGGGGLSSDEEDLLSKNLSDRYQLYTSISDSELNQLYNNAFCLLYPSRYEGFGIPVAEAMQAGCPLVAANCSSIPEVAGDAGLLVDDLRADKFVELMRQLKDPKKRQNVIKAGKVQSDKFNWDKCFQETKDFYNTIM